MAGAERRGWSFPHRLVEQADHRHPGDAAGAGRHIAAGRHTGRVPARALCRHARSCGHGGTAVESHVRHCRPAAQLRRPVVADAGPALPGAR
ncbi:hypothetical protein G6F66_015554 [Rhizopus arrhizus]|nr:hypothetical protein G6F24_017882 [Rhizopus arrhizus]KAG1247279.1 hypothetical protein G6F66_015554 [Rhizopus arrhizus]